MPDHVIARRQISLLSAQAAAAERAAGMSNDRIAECERTMERHIRERRWDADEGTVTDAAMLAFRLTALHIRLPFAEDCRIAQKKPDA